jgi:hypothetical protein
MQIDMSIQQLIICSRLDSSFMSIKGIPVHVDPTCAGQGKGLTILDLMYAVFPNFYEQSNV